VWSAFENTSDGEYVEGVWIVNERTMLAAALRAAADQVVPEDDPSSFIPGAPRSYAVQRRTTRTELLAIAAELEGSNG
jgi:hypothetical protein